MMCQAGLLLLLDISDKLVAGQPNGVSEEDQLVAEANQPQ